MSRYIDADKLFLHFNDWALAMSPDERHSDVPEYSEHKIHEMIYRTINEAMSAIEQQPTADVVEVVHGKWSKENIILTSCPPQYRWHCSNCGKAIQGFDSSVLTSFCPNCGADMRGEVGDDE